jgi:hypothetical protein
MGSVLIQTLGSRDLTVNKVDLINKVGKAETVQEIFTDNWQLIPRSGGAFLKDHFDTVKRLVDAPIVRPAVDFVLSRNPQIDQVILVVTDQNEEEAGKLQQQDSVNYAEFLQRWLPDQYNKRGDPKIGDVKVARIARNVNYLDSMFSEWQQKLTGKPFSKIAQDSHIYLCNQGGIDAINTALMLNGINYFGSRMTLLAVSERTGTATVLGFPDQFRREQTKTKVEALLNNYNYAPLSQFDIPELAKQWAAFAHSRLSFDFSKAQQTLSELTIEDHSLKEQFLAKMNEFQQDQTALVKELAINAKIKFQQGEYVDFLLRVFRVVEEISKVEALDCLEGLNIDTVTFRNWKKRFNEYLEKPENANLKAQLDQETVNNKPLEYLQEPPSTLVFMGIIRCCYGNESPLLKKLEQIQVLAELRNRSIGAHSFDPVSSELIDQQLAEVGTSIDTVFAFLDDYFGIDDNPYDQINQIIRNRLN